MNICLVGPGAVGSLWACHLHNDGHNVSLWTRTHQQTLSLQLDEHTPIVFDANRTQSLASAELVIVAVKAWQVKQALSPLLCSIDQQTPILFTHNGMGAVDEMATELQERPLLFATTTHGAYKPMTGKVLHTGKGQTTLGALNSQGQAYSHIAHLLDSALTPVHWDTNLSQALWNKLAINCCINPLTAILNCTNGGLDTPENLATIETLSQEIAQVMQAEGLNAKAKVIFERVKGVIKATSANYSSMHQDVFHQRRTEIDYISGYLIRCAKQHDIAVTTNERLYLQIKDIENLS